ncbi:Disrupted in renal carcinoma protein 2 [Nymphon striatum]|nr:Disrupted in renal carcinoma protein 2 [Nymphon striatum]
MEVVAIVPRLGRHVDLCCKEAFLKVVDDLVEYDDEQTTVCDLVDRMSQISSEPYSVKYMYNKLENHLGDSIVILNINCRPDVVTFQTTAAKILQTFSSKTIAMAGEQSETKLLWQKTASSVSDMCPSRNNFDEENTELPTSNLSLKVYKRRWIIICIFSVLCLMQNAVYTTWGPIEISAEKYFGWDDGDIAMLNNWGNINSILFTFPYVWLMNNKGIRLSVLLSGALLVFSTGVRCITKEAPYALWMMNTAQFLNGISAIISFIAPASLAVMWFAMNERVTALTIMSVSCTLGVCFSFLIGLSVNGGNFNNQTDSRHQNISDLMDLIEKADHTKNGNAIFMIMYSEFGICVLLFIIILAYFPNKPELPPSVTASQDRTDFKSAMKSLMRNMNIWLLCFGAGVMAGVNNLFVGMLAIVLKHLQISQEKAQFMGIYSQIIAVIIPILIGRFADKIHKIIKLLLVIVWIILIIACILLVLMSLKCMPSPTALVYVIVVLISSTGSICGTLVWEMGCEITYPVPEVITLGLISLTQSILAAIIVSLFKVPHIGTEWVLYACAGSAIFGFILILPIRIDYNRIDIDTNLAPTTVENSNLAN